MVKSVLFSLLVVTLALAATKQVQAQCLIQSAALGACASSNNIPDPQEDACELCIQNVILTNFGTEDCTAVAEATCTGIAGCPCGEGICTAEIQEYATCEINDEREEVTPALSSCPALDCSGTAPTTPAPTTAPAPDAQISAVASCLAQGSNLGSCFEANGVSDADEAACETCIEDSIYANFNVTCDALGGAVCGAVGACTCPEATCVEEIDAYVACETAKERAGKSLVACPAFLCSEDGTTGAPAADSSNPTPAPETTEEPNSGPGLDIATNAPSPGQSSDATTNAPPPATTASGAMITTTLIAGFFTVVAMMMT
jgi:hypothetical protein